jgi:HEPN domain-containing protein
MSPNNLPEAYLKKSLSRMKALQTLLDDKSYSDVVREAQEIVELVSKGILRIGLIDPPHRRDVAKELGIVKLKFDQSFFQVITELETANHWLRREREMSFYGADDFDPTEGYSIEDAARAFRYAKLATETLQRLLAESK